jgi:phospholipase/lecithinase/hemolysin
MSHAITASAQWLAQGDNTYDGLAGTFAGLTSLYPTYDAMTGAALPTAVLGESTGIVDQFGLSVSDRGTAIPWSFTHGWKELNPGNSFRFDGVESLWKKTSSLTVTVGVTVSDSLSDDATTDPETTGTFDLATGGSHFVGFGANSLLGQFVQVRQSAASQVESMEHRMSGLFSWPRATA